MPETGSPDITGATQRVDQILKDTPSTKINREAMEQKAKEEMQRTMGELEAARKRIGNFCVTIGGGDSYKQKVVMFPEPVEGPFSDADPRSALRYVMATKDGFKSVKVLAPDPQSADQKEYGWAQKVSGELKMYLDAAVNSRYEMLDQKASGYSVGERLVIKAQATMGKGAEVRFYNSPVSGLEDADQLTVEKALQASIGRVQAVHQAGLNRATQTLETSQVVQKAVGVGDKTTPQSSRRFTLFGRK